jgi:hypothetical protein
LPRQQKCQWPSFLPNYGHHFSPLVATNLPTIRTSTALQLLSSTRSVVLAAGDCCNVAQEVVSRAGARQLLDLGAGHPASARSRRRRHRVSARGRPGSDGGDGCLHWTAAFAAGREPGAQRDVPCVFLTSRRWLASASIRTTSGTPMRTHPPADSRIVIEPRRSRGSGHAR